MGTLQFIQTTPEKLAELIKDGVKSELEILKKELLHENANDEILTREQVCKILSINPSTLWHWQKKVRFLFMEFLAQDVIINAQK